MTGRAVRPLASQRRPAHTGLTNDSLNGGLLRGPAFLSDHVRTT